MKIYEFLPSNPWNWIETYFYADSHTASIYIVFTYKAEGLPTSWQWVLKLSWGSAQGIQAWGLKTNSKQESQGNVLYEVAG